MSNFTPQGLFTIFLLVLIVILLTSCSYSLIKVKAQDGETFTCWRPK